MERYIFTILAIAISPTLISSSPFLWKTRTTTTTAATTVSSSTSSNSSATTNSTTLNFNNGNNFSVPLTVRQTGSTVDASMVTTLDQFIGDLNITLPTGRSARSIRTIFTSDLTNYTSDIQNCINQYPFEYESALNNAVSDVINCITSGSSSRSFSPNEQILIQTLIEKFINHTIYTRQRGIKNYQRTIFNGVQINIVQCALAVSDKIAEQALGVAQNINECIAANQNQDTSSTSTTNTTSTTTTTTKSTA